MSLTPSTPTTAPPTTPETHTFTVGLAGRFAGDDGTGGHFAALLHYACRMAAQLDSILGHGPLTAVRVRGTRAVEARIGWGVGGECLLQAGVRTDDTGPFTTASPAPPLPASSDPSDIAWARTRHETLDRSHLDTVVRAAHDRTAATWTVLLDSSLRPERLFGEFPSSDLAVLASRCQGVRQGLGLAGTPVLVLTYTTASLLVLAVPRGARDDLLVISTPAVEPDALAHLVAVVREALMTPHAPVVEPADEPAPADQADQDGEDDFDLPSYDFVPAGARFAGQLQQREPRTRRWGRSAGPGV